MHIRLPLFRLLQPQLPLPQLPLPQLPLYQLPLSLFSQPCFLRLRQILLRQLLLGCVVLLSGLMLSSCAALSVTHRKAVAAFVGRADTLALSPSVVVSELAQIRRHRGAIYSSTLSSHELRMEELELLINDETESASLGMAADLSAKLLRTYAGALSYLAHTNRYEKFEIGRAHV